MKILSITGGAAGMYCGSCLRDNALAAELLVRGHDVTLLPLYTPTLTDEANVSHPRVLFGGISLYLQQYSPLFRKTPRFLDRILDSPRVIGAFAHRAVSTNPHTLGDLTVSMLEGPQGVLRKEFDKLLDWLASEPAPDVVNLPNSLLIGLARPLKEALDRPICCTLQGEDQFLGSLIEPYRSRALDLILRQVKDVDRFIAVTEFHAAFMSTYLDIPAGRLSVVPLGINMTRHEARGSFDDEVFRVGYLARIVPEKGLHLLADAFCRFRTRAAGARLRLEVAGYLAPDQRPYLADVQRILDRAGYLSDFTYRGALDLAGKLAFLRSLDVFSVPATCDEPKGLFVLESMASGVPVVQPRRGAFVEMVGATGGGLLVDPDDAASLAEGLYTLWRDRELRERLGRQGFAGVRVHYTIQRSADRLLGVYADVTGQARPEYHEDGAPASLASGSAVADPH
jgi:glycosyltransferase involved in cell wall biosynthesis